MKNLIQKKPLLKNDFLLLKQARQYLGMACLLLMCFLQPYLSYAQTFNGTTGPIPDATLDPDEFPIPSTVDFTANVTGLPGTIGTDYTIANVTINIEHTWDSDLDISLVGPDGTTTLNLSDDNGDNGFHYTNTVFTDAATTNITAGSAPFTGSFKPEGPGTLASVFNGSAVNGIWTLRITDDLNFEEGTLLSWSITFQAVNPPVVLNCPSSTTTTACQTQSALNNAFALWLLTASATGGCNGVLSNNNVAQGGAPPACGGSRTVTFTYTSTCLPLTTTCQATFTVPAAPTVSLTCPVNTTTTACQTQAAVDAAFATWLATASGTGGCNGTLTNNSASLGGAPPACGGSRTVTFIYTSTCAPTTTTCQATFTVPAAPTVTLTCPTNTTTTACQTQAAVNAAFGTWLATASGTGGCNGTLTNNSVSLGGAPSACGGSRTVTFTYTSSCAPTTTTCQATFTVPAAPTVTLTCPTNQTEAFGQTQAAINAKFATWLTTVAGSGGCNGALSNNNIGAPPATGGSATVTFTYTSGCAPLTTTCQASFTVSSTPPVVLTCPVNTTASACLTQAQLTAQYNAWLATASGSGGCGGVLTNNSPGAPSICSATAISQTVEFTYTSTCAPFVTTCQRTFTVPAYPDFNGPPNSGAIRVCLAQTEQPIPPVINDACGKPIIPTGPVVVDAPNPLTCEGTRTYTFTYTDCAGHSKDWSFVWTLDVPTLSVDAPGIATVSCPSAPPPTYPNTITDACGRPVTVTGPTVTSSPDPITCEGTRTYTWNLTDCAGNTNTWSYIINIERNDFTLPANGGSTVACPAAANVVPTPPTKMSECGEPIIPTGPVVTATPACEGTKTYTWTYTDCEGNSHDWLYTYTIERNDFTVPANGSATVSCPSAITTPTPPTVTSNCGETLTPTGPVVVNTPDPLTCAGTRVYTYTYTDCEGNIRTWSFTYTVSPTLPVTITCPTNTTTTACQTPAQLNAAYSNWLNTASFSGGCNGSLTSTQGVPSVCGSSTTLTFTHINACGNQSCQATFTVPAPPPVVLTCPTEQEEAFGQTQAAINAKFATWLATATGSGGCNGVLTNNNTGAPPASGGTTTVTFTYTSSCAPLTTTCQATFTVSSVPPVVLTCPTNTTTTACQTQAAVNTAFATWLATASGTGGCNGVLTNNNTGAPSACGGSTTVTFTYLSSCAPLTTTCQATFTVPAAPNVVLTCPANTTTTSCQTQAAVDAAFATWLATASGTGGCNGVLTNNNTGAPPACGGFKTVTFTYTSTCAPLTTTCQATFTVPPPPLPAFYTCPSNTTVAACQTQAAVNQQFGSWLSSQGNGIGGCGGVLTNNNTGAPSACGGSTTVTFTYTASCGTTSCQATFTVAAAPVVLTCPNNTTASSACLTQAQLTAEYNAWLATASGTGGCNGVLTNNSPGAPSICSATAVSQTVTFTYTSSCAPFATTCQATFTVPAYPSFTVPANGAATVSCPVLAVTPTPPTVVDGCGKTVVLTGPIIINAPNPITCEGTRTYTYTYTDCAGTVRTWSFNYTIERQPFTVPANGAATVACPANATPPTPPTVTSNCGETITPTGPVITNAPNPLNCEGTRTYAWTYTDCEGNTAVWSFVYTIEREPFTVPANGVATVACVSAITVPTPPTVTSNCGETITPTGPVITNAPNPLSCEGTRTYAWTYTDCEGNTAVWSFVYTIEREPFTVPANGAATVACVSAITVPTTPAVTSNCGEILTPSAPVITNAPNPIACEGTRTYAYTYTDCEGNTAVWSFVYTIEREPFTVPANGAATVACPALAVAPTTLPTVLSNCGETLTPSAAVMSNVPNPLTCEGTRTYAYTYTDCEGNTATWSYVYTIERLPFTVPANGVANVQCLADAIAPTPPVVLDNCGGNITPVAQAPVNVPAIITCTGTRTFSYVYTDCEGNTATWSFVYNINDNTPPLITSTATTCAPVNFILSSTGTATLNSANIPFTATDNCGGAVNFVPNSVTYNASQSGIPQSFVFTVVDRCNNTSSCTKTVNIIVPRISVSEALVSVGPAAPTDPVGHMYATFVVKVKNTGTATLNSLTLVNSLAALGCAYQGFAPGGAPSIVASTASVNPGLNSGFNGITNTSIFNGTSGTLAGGQEISVQFRLLMDPNCIGAPTLSQMLNQSLAGGTFTLAGAIPNTITVTDLSDDGLTPFAATGASNGGTDTPTTLHLPNVHTSMRIAGMTAPFDGSCVAGNLVANMEIRVKNTGNTVLNSTQISSNIAAQLGAAFGKVLPGTLFYLGHLSNPTAAPTMNQSFNGSSNQNMFSSLATLSTNEEIVIGFMVEVNPSATGAPVNPRFNATVNAVATIAAGASYPVSDLTDAGSLPESLNASAPGHTALSHNDASPFGAPTIATASQNLVVNACDTWQADIQLWLNNAAGTILNNGANTISCIVNDYYDKGWVNTGCGLNLYRDVRFTVKFTDIWGEMSEMNFCASVTVVDNLPPSFDMQPMNKTVDCSAGGTVATVQAWLADGGGAWAHACSGDITWSNNYNGTLPTCNTPRTVVFTATDGCGRSATASAILTVIDNTAPVFTSVPANTTISCPATPSFGAPTANDGCGTVNLTFTDAGSGGQCPAGYTVTRTWLATDACGNSRTASATITVLPQPIASTVSIICPANISMTAPVGASGMIVNYASATATSANCAASSVVTVTRLSGPASGSIFPIGNTTVCYTATNACGVSTSCCFTVTVTAATAPPVTLLSLTNCPSDQTITAVVGATGAVATFAMPSATTTCNSQASVVQTTGAASGQIFAVGVNQVCFRATDACGNVQTCCFTITVNASNATPSVLSATAPPNQTITCDGAMNWATPITSTTCPGGVVSLISADTQTGAACTGLTHTRTWIATDACGGVKTVSATIFQQPDNVPPTFTSLPPLDQMIHCGTPVDIGTATASDFCGSATVTHVVTNNGASACTTVNGITYGFDTYVNWTAADGCGNQTSATTNVWVLPATNIGFLNRPLDKQILCSEAPVFEQPMAKSFVADIVDITFVDITNLDACGAGTVTRLWTAIDALGNTCQAEQTVTIMPDHELPTISLPYTITSVDCQGSLPSVIPLVSDNCTDAIDLVVSYADVQMGSSILRTYQVADACGNVNTTLLTIQLTDNVPPLITGYFPQIEVDCNTPVVFDQPTVYDACPNVSFTYTGYVHMSMCTETHTRTWTATDQSGNVSTAVQTILVTDKQAPVFAGLLEPKTYACNNDILYDTPIAIDLCHTTVSMYYNDVSTTPVCGNSGYTITRTWTANDGCNNLAQVEQVITIEEDTQDPVVLQAPPALVEMTLAQFAQWTPATLAVSDNCSILPIVTTQVTQLDQCNYTLVYVVTDACANATSVEQDIKIIDGPCAVSGTNELQFEGAKLYPNPATHHLTLELPSTVELYGLGYTIYDVLGKVMLEGNISGYRANINIQGLQQGSYFFKISNDQAFVVKGFVKISD